jgi:hypothetical protein
MHQITPRLTIIVADVILKHESVKEIDDRFPVKYLCTKVIIILLIYARKLNRS